LDVSKEADEVEGIGGVDGVDEVDEDDEIGVFGVCGHSVISVEKVRRLEPHGQVFVNASATSSLALAAFLRRPPHMKMEFDVFLLDSGI
jgi:hypothetical protein